jgi:hypothetical protein
MTIKYELTMLTFTKTKNTRLADSVHNAGVTLQSRDIPHTLPSPIFYERAPAAVVLFKNKIQHYQLKQSLIIPFLFVHRPYLPKNSIPNRTARCHKTCVRQRLDRL